MEEITQRKIPPFWQRLEKFFRIPLQKEVLLHGFGLAACSLFIFVPFLGIFVLLLVLLAASRYAFKVAALASYGIFDLENYEPMQEEHDWKHLPWKFAGAVFVQLLFVGFVVDRLPALGPIVFLVFALLLPATIMVIIMRQNLGDAINPAQLWQCVQGIGWPYLILCAFVYLLMQGEALAVRMLKGVIPNWLLLPVGVWVFCYFFWVAAALIGYVMYQYHRTLDIDIVNEYQEEELKQANSSREVARQRDASISRMVRQGDMQNALDQALVWLEESPNSLAENRRYHRLLVLGKDDAALQEHGQQFIALLVKKQAVAEALQTYRACLQNVPDFMPTSAVVSFKLADEAWKAQDSMLALHLLRGFDKRFPGDAQIPAVYALIVRILCQGLQRPEQAMSVLQGLRKYYPNDPYTQEATSVLRNYCKSTPASLAGAA